MNLPMNPENTCDAVVPGGNCELTRNVRVLMSVPVFATVPAERLRLFAYLSRRVYYDAGDFLFRHGESDDKGYIIISGKVQIIREVHDRSLLLKELGEGDFVGGMALLADVKRPFSIKAVTPVECLTLDRESFRKLVAQFPEVGASLLEMMVQRMMEMEEKLLCNDNYACHLP